MSSPAFHRYVALGDSSTEGLDDPDGNGGFRGWANRLAERLARTQGSVLYANLGVRGLRTAEIRETQLERARAMKPDLVTLFSGTNDVVGGRFDPNGVGRDVLHMHRALIGGGATLITFTLPDLTPVMPVARLVERRVLALNDALREASARSGAILVDIARHPVASDPRLWSEDRLHANALGHARIAEALAHGLGLSGADDRWAEPLPPMKPTGRGGRWAAEVSCSRKYLVPWIWRAVLRRSSGEGLGPKRPGLEPMVPGP